MVAMSAHVNSRVSQEMTALTLRITIVYLSKVSILQACPFPWADPPHSAMPPKIPLLQGGELRQGSTHF